MADESELAFVATMRDEASAVAKQARRSIDAAGGTATGITVPLKAQDGLTGSLRSAQAQLAAFSDKSTAVGQTLTKTITAPILGIGLAAGHASIDFSRSMGDVASLLPGNTARVDELRKAVLDIGPASGASLGDTAQGLYQTLSAFGDTADTAKILATNAKAARAGAASVSDAIALTSAVTKSYGDTSAKAVKHAADLGLMTVRLGQTTFPELASSVGSVTPLMKTLGGTQAELFATMATFTGVTGGASEVSTQLRGALQALMAPTDSAAKAIKKAGYDSGKSLVQHEGLAGALGVLTDAADKSGAPLQNYISSIEGQMTALGLAGAQGKSYKKNLDAMAKSTGATDAAFRSSTTGVGEQAFAWDKAKAEADKLLISVGDGLAPAVTDLLKAAAPLVDKVKGWADAFANADPHTQKMIATVIGLTAMIGPLLIAVGSVGRGISGTIGAVASLTSAFSKTKAAGQDLEGTMTSAGAKTSAFGARARAAAGIAGVAGLALASTKADGKMKTFASVASSALMGFAAGGPLGAAIGGGIGLLTTLGDTSNDTGKQIDDLKQDQYDLRDALDQTTGAITRQARENIVAKMREDGVLDAANLLKISQKDLVGASLGHAKAQDRVNAALRDASGALKVMAAQGKLTDGVYTRMAGAIDTVHGSTGAARREFEGSRREIRQWNAALDSAVKIAKALPPKVRTKVLALGTAATIGDLRKLRKQYDLSPKEVRTMVRVLNTDASKKQIRAVQKELEDTGHTKVDLSAYMRGVTSGTNKAKDAATRGGKATKDALEKPIREVRPSLENLWGGLKTGTAHAAGIGHEGGSGIGRDLDTGVMAGLVQNSSRVNATASWVIEQAIAAARRKADAHSPSRVTAVLGRDLADGVSVGLHARARSTAKAAHTFTGEILGVLLRDLVGGTDQVEKSIDTLHKRIEAKFRARFKGDKHAGDETQKHTAAAIKGLRDEEKAIRKNAGAYDALVGKLKAARQAGDEFASGLRSYASVSSFQSVNDAPVTAGFLASDLRDRLHTIEAFAKDLATLRSRHVSAQVIRDLQDQGVEAGGASAAALASATDEQLREINSLTGKIGDTADAAGKASVAGLVRGLLGNMSAVEAAGQKLARRLRNSIRRELGIHSPSRRLAEDGRDSALGMARGLIDGTGTAEAAARVMAERVANAAVPSIPDLTRLASASARIRPIAVASSEVLVIRHEVVSPDGSVSDLTAAQVADLLARDPRSARGIEDLLSRHRTRRSVNRISPSS